MLNATDIQDYTSEFSELQPQVNPKKLYELQRETYFKVLSEGWDDLLQFHKLDGMYSICTFLTGKNKGQIVHINVTTPVVEYGK